MVEVSLIIPRSRLDIRIMASRTQLQFSLEYGGEKPPDTVRNAESSDERFRSSDILLGRCFALPAYIKNRTYSSAINDIPYEAMWSRRPDIHHLRKFGALAYVHTKVGAARNKFADNCRVGVFLGYREGQLGCKVYFPTKGTVQYARQVTHYK